MYQAQYKQLQSNVADLAVRRSGKEWLCCGIFVERGSRPGKLQDVWMVGHSRRCSVVIDPQQLYVANSRLPQWLMMNLDGGWIPTCLFCALDSYPEHFQGPDKAKYLRPLTPERRQQVQEGLLKLLSDAEDLLKEEAA